MPQLDVSIHLLTNTVCIHRIAFEVFKSNTRQKSDADIIRDAKLEAMGLRAEDHEPRQHREKAQTATDEMVSSVSHGLCFIGLITRSQVMERFKKRMRK